MTNTILTNRHRVTRSLSRSAGAVHEPSGGLRMLDGQSYLTTAAAARSLGVTPRRIIALITDQRLRATRYGRDWFIRPSDLDDVRERRPGRPAVSNRRPGAAPGTT